MRRETSNIYTRSNIFGKMDLEKVFLGDKRIACEFIRKCESED